MAAARSILLVLLAAAVAAAEPGRGAAAPALLAWEATLVECAGQPAQDAAHARYRFAVASPVPVTVKVAKTSCGCTTARLAKERYEPGEAGEIEAIFEFGGFEGQQRKLITIEAIPIAAEGDPAGPSQRTQLVLSASVPRLCSLEPTTLVWPKGGAGEERSVTLVEDRSGPIRLRSMRLVGTGFATVFPTVPGGEGGTYVFSVRPESTAARATAAIELQFDLGNGRTRSKHFFARVDDR